MDYVPRPVCPELRLSLPVSSKRSLGNLTYLTMAYWVIRQLSANSRYNRLKAGKWRFDSARVWVGVEKKIYSAITGKGKKSLLVSFQCGCEAISDRNCKITWNCLTYVICYNLQEGSNLPHVDCGCHGNRVTIRRQNSHVCRAVIGVWEWFGVIWHVVVCHVIPNFFT